MKDMCSIIWINGERSGEKFELVEILYLVGRSRRCDICLASSDDVSGRHISLERTGGCVRLINLSAHQCATFRNGQALEPNENVVLENGDTVQLGSSNVFRFSDGTAECVSADQEKMLISGADPDKTVVPGVSPMDVPTCVNDADMGGGASSPQQAQPPSPSDGERKNALAQTQIIQTLLASTEEMVALIRKKAGERRQRLVLKMLGAGFVFVAFSVIYILFVKTSPEKVLTWPSGENGRPDSRQFVSDSPLGARMIGLEYPNHPSAKLIVETNGIFRITAVSRLGRNRDVPFVTTLTVRRDPSSLREERETTFLRWRLEREEKDGWNFQSLSPREFIGFEHGIPYINAQYLRSIKTKDETMQFFGYLLFARMADYVITVSREIPAEERWRGASVLSANVGLLTSRSLWKSQWEGSASIRNADPVKLLAEAEGVLASKATQRWGEVEFLLRSALAQSYGKDDAVFSKIHARWIDLRERQEREFARLQSQFMKTRVMRDKKAGETIIADAIKVFSSPDDRRNMLLLKGRWR